MPTLAIPPGTVFKRLTVIEEAPGVGPRGLRAMLCRCECGTVKVISLAALRQGQKSCGCARHDAGAHVPPGTVFGLWTVIGEAPNVHGRRMALCRCECGTVKAVHLGSLRRGITASCGCRGNAPDLSLLHPGEVPLYGKTARGRVALVDLEDYELVSRYRWNATERGTGHHTLTYAVGRPVGSPSSRPTTYMHSLVAGWPQVDHIDNDGLNNRRSNLRECTQTLNNANARLSSSNTSGYKGVTWAKDKRRWRANIQSNGKTTLLGHFLNAEDAARAYDAAAIAAWGEFARVNFQGAA